MDVNQRQHFSSLEGASQPRWRAVVVKGGGGGGIFLQLVRLTGGTRRCCDQMTKVHSCILAIAHPAVRNSLSFAPRSCPFFPRNALLACRSFLQHDILVNKWPRSFHPVAIRSAEMRLGLKGLFLRKPTAKEMDECAAEGARFEHVSPF